MAQLLQIASSENWKPRFSSMSQKSKIVFDFFPTNEKACFYFPDCYLIKLLVMAYQLLVLIAITQCYMPVYGQERHFKECNGHRKEIQVQNPLPLSRGKSTCYFLMVCWVHLVDVNFPTRANFIGMLNNTGLIIQYITSFN